MSIPPWPKVIRALHLALAVLVSFQLFSELQMHALWKIVGFYPHAMYWAHMISGILTLGVILVFWAEIYRHGELRRHLFPYRGIWWQRVLTDLEGLFQRTELPPAGMRGGLPGLVHGWGILIISIMALSGLFMFYLIISAGGVKPAPEYYALPKTIHSLVANLLWAYWSGHLFMAGVHALQDRQILRIFVLRND